MLLKVRVALAFQAQVHPHCDQELNSEVRYLVGLVTEDAEHHGDYAQADHQHSGLLGKRDALEDAQDRLAASALLTLNVENTHQILD
jgi:tRNA isopentenyl-2-thiomethyl-A-37 hydroxylase MiaE